MSFSSGWSAKCGCEANHAPWPGEFLARLYLAEVPAPRQPRGYWNVIVTSLAGTPSTVTLTVTWPAPASESGSATLI